MAQCTGPQHCVYSVTLFVTYNILSLLMKPESKVFDVWFNLEAKLEDKIPYHVAFETIKEWVDIEGELHPMLARGPRDNVLP
jgi:hypothetical protein